MANVQDRVRPPLQTYLPLLVVVGLTHSLNDFIQSLIPALYPLIKAEYGLDFIQIGLITLTFQIAGSLLQPAVGFVTDRHPMPYASVVGMLFSLAGVLGLAFASSYGIILLSAACVGIGSSIFHPEATRMIRNGAGARQGLGQGIFQVGGQAGGALGPLIAALVVVPRGQSSIAWFALAAVAAVLLMTWTARQHKVIVARISAAKSQLGANAGRYPARTVIVGLSILTLLMFSKNSYLESFRSFYTFYLIDHFDVTIPVSQLMLFVFLVSSAIGALIGGMVGDRIGRYRIIWISVLGPLPLTLLLPFADFFWTGVLTVLINLVMASAFASILIYAMELVPNRIGLIGGLFYGLNFALGGIAAVILGVLADSIGIVAVYRICAFLPLAGLLTWFLPRIEDARLGR